MKIHHHSCKCGWSDLDWCQEPGCMYPEQSDVCPRCQVPEDSMSYKELLSQRAILAAGIHQGDTECQSSYDAIQVVIASRSGTNIYSRDVTPEKFERSIPFTVE